MTQCILTECAGSTIPPSPADLIFTNIYRRIGKISPVLQVKKDLWGTEELIEDGRVERSTYVLKAAYPTLSG